jgi:hypothetical protein
MDIPVRPLLVQNPMSALPAPNRLSPLQRHRGVAFAAAVLDGAVAARGDGEAGAGACGGVGGCAAVGLGSVGHFSKRQGW